MKPQTPKATLYISPPIEAARNLVPTQSLSGRLADVCERFVHMVRDELEGVDFTPNEWGAMVDANDPEQFTGDQFPRGIAMNVRDAKGLDAKWNVNAQILAQEIEALRMSTRVAIAEQIDRLWSERQMLEEEEKEWNKAEERDEGDAK